MRDSDDPRHAANIYSPHDYESIVEDYSDGNVDVLTPSTLRQSYKNLFGDFTPTFYQYEWHRHFTQRDENGRFLKNLTGSAVIHRRAGKTVGVLKAIMLPWMLENVGHYMHIFPTLKQGRDALWNGLGKTTRDPDKQAIPYLEMFPKELWLKKNNHDMSLTLKNGSIYQIGGARGVDGTANHFRGYNVAGLVADEYSEWQEGVIDEIFTPMFMQNGGWCFKVFTPKGENHSYESFMLDQQLMKEGDKRFYAMKYGADMTNYNDGTPVIPPELIELERKKGTPEDKIQQELFCDFKALPGGLWFKDAYILTEKEGRIVNTKYNPNYQAYSVWDIGLVDHNVSLIFQAYSGFYRFVDVIFKDNSSLGEVMDSVNSKYNIYKHLVPHDTDRNQDMIDVVQSRVVRLELVKGIKNIQVIEKPHSVTEGIALAREFMSQCIFDPVACAKLLWAFKNYKKKKDLSTGKYYNEVAKGESNHFCDAFRMAAIAVEQGFVEMGMSMISLGSDFTRRRNRKPQDEFYEFNIPFMGHDIGGMMGDV